MSDSSKPNIGMIGLAVMGSNLARNIESRGNKVAVYNRTYSVTEEFMSNFGEGTSAEGGFVASETLEAFVESIERPRQVFIMVKAGRATDAVIDGLIPLLVEGDIIIDGGNAHYTDTRRREKLCHDNKLNFMGIGISGGEEGALKGPSIMPGGPKDAYKIMEPMLKSIAADADGPCTAYMGPDGAGHFVKMVHNGIEYGDMQLIAECYQVLKDVIGLTPDELASTFTDWNNGVLCSFLIEITGKIFTKKDDDTDNYLVDVILDKAGQKGTGKWTVESALDLGVAIPTIAAAVTARTMSSIKDERIKASEELSSFKPSVSNVEDKQGFIKAVHDALYCSKIMSYAQGMDLLKVASKEFDWNLNLGEIASIWKGGCIIRAKFLDDIRKSYDNKADLANLMLDDFMKNAITESLSSLRSVVSVATASGIPNFALSASLSYFDSYRLEHLPQNLTQAQRDFFGAHTFQRKDKEGVFHAEWE